MGANFTVQPHYPYMGRGLIRSLFILVWEALYQIFMEGHRETVTSGPGGFH
jgi:hypothetical protein